MKQLTCEMCGSTDLIKQDGVFVCQSCGCKYSVEEAKKLMVEGTVEIQGTVKVDLSDRLENLYILARRAKKENNTENAAKYYAEIAVEDPNSWEANFYSTYYSVMQTTIGNIPSEAAKLCNSLGTVVELLCGSSEDKQTVKGNIETIYNDIDTLAMTLFSAFRNYFLKFRASASICVSYNAATLAIANILYNFGNLVEKHFKDDSEYTPIAVRAWKRGLAIRNTYFEDSPVYGNTGIGDTKESIEVEVKLYSDKIKEYEQDYTAPTVKGCYVATAVYGSYDCPEVWTLRRYRDYILAKTWFGRMFIRAYYAISPTIVKWFGHTGWFKQMWKGTLDRMVERLNADGIADTPYRDKTW